MWRESLLKEEAALNARLAELEQEGDEKRFEDAREEASARLTEVHQSLADMDAESGPARAASLLAGRASISLFSSKRNLNPYLGLGFSEADQHRPTKSFSGGWRLVVSIFLFINL